LGEFLVYAAGGILRFLYDTHKNTKVPQTIRDVQLARITKTDGFEWIKPRIT
jgi:hypothetical protein